MFDKCALSAYTYKLIHDYMGINYLIVWDVAKNIIPVLIPQIKAIIEKENHYM